MAERFDLVAKEFNADRQIVCGREDVNNTASDGEFADEVHLIHMFVVLVSQPFGEPVGAVKVLALVGFECERSLLKELYAWYRLHQGLHGSDDESCGW